MIRTFRHRGLRRFFATGDKSGIQPKHAARLRLQLGALNRAPTATDMCVPSWRLHALGGKLKGHWSIWVDENWRLTFTFAKEDAVLLDYQDYH